MKRILVSLALLALVACQGTRVNPKGGPTEPPGIFGAHTHGYSDLPGTVVRSDGSIPFTSPQQGVTPVGGTDLTTKTYVDGVASGASATKKVLVSSLDTTEDYLDPSLLVGTGLTKTINNGGANETLTIAPDFGTTAGKIAQGNDSRFTDGRAPTGSAGGDLTGTYPNPTFAFDRIRKDVFTTKGDLLVTWAASDVRRLAVGTDGYVLTADSTTSPGVAWKTASSLAPHALLDHTDGTAGPVVRGDLVVGNSTPKWTSLAKGTAYQRLSMGSAATDPGWAALPLVNLGPTWYVSNPGASGTAVLLGFGSADTSAGRFVVPYAGTLRGFSWFFTGTHSAGTITFRIRKNGTADNTYTLVSGASDTKGYGTGTGVTFAAGDDLTVEYDTSGTWNGTSGLVTAQVWVSYDA